MNISDDLLWRCRAFVYRHFADTGHAPTAATAAKRFSISPELAAAVFRELHERHALYLDPVTASIRMANPFSAIVTNYRVLANGRSYWANCAWDALGIPAALQSDARIEAECSGTGAQIRLSVADGRVSGPSAPVVHFPLPFRHWYDDLVFT